MATPRKIPRPFSYDWGGGQIVEEASYVGQYHEPTIQLLEYDEGGLSVRFCVYNEGRFYRSPLLVGDDEIAGLRRSLEDTPRLRELLGKLTG